MIRYRDKALQLALVLGVALCGAMLAKITGLPIPFLLGSLSFTAVLSVTLFARTGRRLWYPVPLRKAFIGVIGTMIGTTFSPDILGVLPGLGITLTAMIPFLGLSFGAGYLIFRMLGHYDRATAAYAAMPGGLIEAVTLGEKAGGDVEILSVQHFARIILVVILVPSLFYVWTGHSVGSSAGQSMQRAPAIWQDWAIIPCLAGVGIVLGEKLRLPAGHMIGPLALTALLHALDILHVNGPTSLLGVAQLVAGAGLGTMFARATIRRLFTSFGLGFLAVVVMLGLGMVFAAVLQPYVPLTFEALLVSFAPGGVTEMGLIALSLGISPVIVVAHHLFRILVTVLVAGFFTPS